MNLYVKLLGIFLIIIILYLIKLNQIYDINYFKLFYKSIFLKNKKNSKNNSKKNIKNKNKYNKKKQIDLTFYRCNENKIRQVLQDSLRELNIKKINNIQNASFYLPCGYNLVEQELKNFKPSNSNQKIFGIINCDKLCSKKFFWLILRNTYSKYECKFITPTTYNLADKNFYNIFNSDVLKKNTNKNNTNNVNTYILKSNLQNKKGLYITNNYNEIMNLDLEKFKIIQDYIQNVFTINKHKLNIRFYVLVINYNFKTYWLLYKKGKCLYTNKEYDKYKSNLNNNLKDKEQHFTSFNFDVNNYNKKKLPETLKELNGYLKDDYNKLIEKIIKKLKLVKTAYEPIFSKKNNLNNNICFQHFGLDVILLNKSKEPLFLEFNKGPSMATLTNNDKYLKKQIHIDTFNLFINEINDLKSNKDIITNLNLPKINNWYIIN